MYMRINWSDKKEVLAAVKANGGLLQHTYKFRNDKEVVLTAVKHNCNSFEFAGNEIKELVSNGNPIEILTMAISLEKNGITVDPWVDVYELQSKFELSKKLQTELPKNETEQLKNAPTRPQRRLKL